MTQVAIGFTVPDDQRIRYTVTPLDGQLMSAESIGGQLVELSKLLRAVGKDDDPKIRWMVAILNIETLASGEITFDLILAPKMKGRNNGVQRPAPAAEGER